MKRTLRSHVLAGVTVLVLGALTACDPPILPATLVVTTVADGADADPGDGVCEVTVGAGDCSLRAAVDEGNALGAAAITLPVGTYRGLGFDITGNLSINHGAPVDAILGDQRIVVAPGATLVVDGLSSYGVPGARFEVGGTFVGNHLSLVGLESIGQVLVAPTGTALLQNSLFAHVFGVRGTVQNQGTVVLRNVALLSWNAVGVTTPALVGPGTTTVSSSAIQSCSGADPTSVGYNTDDDGSCGLAAPGDRSATPAVFTIHLVAPVTYDLVEGSPLIDAIPVGVNGCGTEVADDLSRVARPADGDGDGVAACDIGARELPAPAAA